jgi:hypothetical protein
MISSLSKYLLVSTLQFCDWHVSQNIKVRLLKEGYIKDLREQVV